MRTEQRDRLEAGGFLRQPRNAPLKAYNGDEITRSDCAWTSSRYERIVNCSVLLTVDFVLLLNGARLYASRAVPNP